MQLDLEAARSARSTSRSPSRSGSSLVDAADGILRIAATQMSHVVRWRDHRARPRRRGLRAHRLRRRRPAARHARSRASSRMPRVIMPRAPGHFSRLRHAASPICAATSCAPGSRALADAPFAEMEAHLRARWSAQGAKTVAAAGVRVARDRRHARRRHALRRPGARRHRGPAGRAVHEAQDRDGIKQPLRRRARDALRLLGAAREGRDRQPARRRDRPDAEAAARAISPRAAPSRAAAAPRGKRPVYFAWTGIRRHADVRPRAARRPATASPARR